MEVLCLRLKIINYKLRLVVHRKEDDKMNEVKEYTKKIFEDIKHIDEFGIEYWLARELQSVLEYHQWRRFENVIDKAKTACKNSNVDINEQFADVGKLSINVNGGQRRITDYKLSRYACYLIAQNGDSSKAFSSIKNDCLHILILVKNVT